MNAHPRPIAVTMGDPAGCGPQIASAAWADRHKAGSPVFYLIADPTLMASFGPVQVIHEPGEALACFEDALPVLAMDEQVSGLVVGTPDKAHAPAILASITLAVAHVAAGKAAALVTNPISKAVLYQAGFAHPGHTEFIADLTGAPRPVMMLAGGGLKVALATIHVPLMQTASLLTTDLLVETAKITSTALRRDFGIAAPRLAFSGLNPHAGEDGAMGREEIDIINPAAEQLREEGVSITDARPGDTVFAEALGGAYDAVIAMTHDQGLIPVKTLDMWGGVNTTLGLPVIRTSPDHGTAFEAAAAHTARPDSLIAAIGLASDMAQHRAQADV